MSNKSKNSAPAKEVTQEVIEEAAEETTVVKAEAPKEPKFPIATLREDSYKLYGVSASTFDGALAGFDGELTVKEAGDIIKSWLTKEVK